MSLALAFSSLAALKAIGNVLSHYDEVSWWLAVVSVTCALVIARIWMKNEP